MNDFEFMPKMPENKKARGKKNNFNGMQDDVKYRKEKPFFSSHDNFRWSWQEEIKEKTNRQIKALCS